MKIALLGFGIEAQSAYKFLRNKFPEAIFEIYDQNEESKIRTPKGVEVFLGVNDFSSIEADLLVRTPAVNPFELPFNMHKTSVTNLFFENCIAPIIGVTGSKGKGTTSSFIAEILRAAGVKVHLIGNIGVPALDVLRFVKPNDMIVYELSSFQLWDVKNSPKIAVITNIEPDHLDVHDDFEDYVSAKMNIINFQSASDICVFNYLNKEVSERVNEIKLNSPAEFIPFPSNNFANIKNEDFYWGNVKLFSTKILRLPGEHNKMNALAAIDSVYEILFLRLQSQDEVTLALSAGLSSFEGLPHRLKFVREFKGVKFYDDSIATTPGSALAALKSFSEPKVIILGGSSKGADLSELIEKISNSNESDLKKVILIGDESNNLAEEFERKNFKRFVNLGLKTNMDEIVKTAFSITQKGEIIILSPAHASFDMFKSYSDRGEQFVAAVKKLV